MFSFVKKKNFLFSLFFFKTTCLFSLHQIQYTPSSGDGDSPTIIMDYVSGFSNENPTITINRAHSKHDDRGVF